MPTIVIELRDNVDENIQKKISAIGTLALTASASIDQLSKALKSINNDALKEYKGLLYSLSAAQTAMIGNSNRVIATNNEMIASIEKVNRAQNNLLKSEQQLAQAYSNTAIRQTKANAEDAKFVRQTEIGNIELARRRAILEATNKIQSIKQTTAQINLAAQAEKNAIGIDRQNIALQTAAEKLRQTELRTEALNGASKKTALSMFTLTNIFRALALIRISEQAFELLDAYTLMNNRLKLVSVSMENNKQLQQEMFKIANETRVPVVELTQAFVRYDFALKGLDATQRESLRFTKTLTEQLAISGLTTAEQTSSLLQLSQALNKGKLDGDEFRTIMETLPTLATAIAKTMGVARGELIKLAPQGKITAEVIRNAMASIAQDTDNAFKNLTPTIGQAFTVLKNNTIELLGKFNEATGITNAFSQSILLLSNNLGVLAAAAVIAGSAFAVRFVPLIVTGIRAIGSASVALLANPIFFIPALITGAFLAIKSVLDRRNALIDAQTEKDNANADAFEKQQERRRKALIYETEATIKLKQEYGKYLTLLAETNDAKKKGFISDIAQKALLSETEIVKGRTKAQELINNKPEATLLDSEILSKQRNKVKEEFDKSLVEMENFIRSSNTLRNENDKSQKNSISTINGLKIQQSIFIQQLKDYERDNPQEDSLFHNSTLKVNALKLQIKTYQDLIDINTDNFNAEFKNGEILTENLKQDIDLQEKLKKELKDRLELLRNIGAETIRVGVINSKDKIQQQYADTLKATNKLVVDGNINQAEAIILLNQTDLIKNRLAITDRIYSFEVKNSTEERLNAINKERDAILLVIEANQRNFEITTDYYDAIKKVQEATKIKKEEEFHNLSQSLLVHTGGGIDNRQKEEIRKEEEGYIARKKALEASFKDEYKNKNENGMQAYQLLLKYHALEETATEEHKAKLKSIELQAAAERFEIYANMFGSLSSLADKFAQSGGKNAKRAFEVTKALAYAEAVATTAAAIAKANDNPYPYNIPAIIAAAATGAAQIATIQSTSIKLARGQVGVGGYGTTTSDSINASISRGESVINSISTSRHRNLLEAINADNGSSTSSINNTYMGDNSSNRQSPTIVIHNNSGSEIKQSGNYNADTNTLEFILDAVDKDQARKFVDGNGKHAKEIRSKIKAGY